MHNVYRKIILWVYSITYLQHRPDICNFITVDISKVNRFVNGFIECMFMNQSIALSETEMFRCALNSLCPPVRPSVC